MTAFLADWLNLLLRWAHLIVGIAWIGASFHFVWLDFSLRRRERMNKGVYGTSWMVHGGGFYHVEKYSSRRQRFPRTCTGSNGKPISLGSPACSCSRSSITSTPMPI